MNGRKQPPTQAVFFAGEASEEKSRCWDANSPLYKYILRVFVVGFSYDRQSLSDSCLVQNKLLSGHYSDTKL